MTTASRKESQAVPKKQKIQKKQNNLEVEQKLSDDLKSESTKSTNVTKVIKAEDIPNALQSPKTQKIEKMPKTSKIPKTPKVPKTPKMLKTLKTTEDSKDNKSANTAGCLTCRQRHKKCSRSKPVCITCLKSSYLCLWREPGTRFTDYSIPLIHLDTPIGRIIKPNKGNPDSLVDSSIDINNLADIGDVTLNNETISENDNSFISVAQKAVSVVNEYLNSAIKLDEQPINKIDRKEDGEGNEKKDRNEDEAEDEDDNDEKKSRNYGDDVTDKAFSNTRKRDPDSDDSNNSNSSSSKNTDTKVTADNNTRSGSSDPEKSTASQVELQNDTKNHSASLYYSLYEDPLNKFGKMLGLYNYSKGETVIDQGAKIPASHSSSLEWYTKNVEQLPPPSSLNSSCAVIVNNNIETIVVKENTVAKLELVKPKDKELIGIKVEDTTNNSISITDNVNSHAKFKSQDQLQLRRFRATHTPPPSPLKIKQKPTRENKEMQFTPRSLMTRIRKERKLADKPRDIDENIKIFKNLLMNVQPMDMKKVKNDKRRSRYSAQQKHIDVKSLPNKIAQFLKP